MANGFLTGSITKDTVFPSNNLNSRYSRAELAERVDYARQFEYLVRGDIESMPQAALRWVLDNTNVSTVLAGPTRKAQILDSAAAADAASFTQVEMDRADDLHTQDYEAA